MFSAKFDKNHNLLRIAYRGYFDKEQGELLYLKLSKDLAHAKKGFMVLSDMTEIDFFDESSIDQIKKIMTFLNVRGVSKVFRVIPDKTKDIGFNILSIFHYSKHVKIYEFKTAEEAKYHVRINTKITLMDRFLTFYKIIRIKIAHASDYSFFRFAIILGGFALLIFIRQVYHAFGISLGYLYITIIALAGFWYGAIGGIIVSAIAFSILLAEIGFSNGWIGEETVLKTLFLRFAVYLLSGYVIGRLAQLERKNRKRIEFLAGHDELTGFLNYRFIMTFLRKEFERCKRHRTHFTIAIIDIDHFKKINDTYGHLVGNDALKEMSKVIQMNLRQEDIVGRYGGDEFFIIFPETNAQQGIRILERIKTALYAVHITSPFLIKENALSLTFSAGVASFSYATQTVNEFIDCADKALYQAKEEGRDRISYYRHKEKVLR